MAAAIGLTSIGSRDGAACPHSGGAELPASRTPPELWALAAALLLLNLHLLPGVRQIAPLPQVFLPGSVSAGEWWRILTHAFVHVSWYHLLLDGVAFLLILGGLRERSAVRRLLLVAASALGSLAAVVLGAPAVTSLGFCGLSGAAHGLMAVSALEMTRSGEASERRLGAALFAGTAAKCFYEALAGRCFLEILHFGLVGTPLAIAHAGGFLAGPSPGWRSPGGERAMERPPPGRGARRSFGPGPWDLAFT